MANPTGGTITTSGLYTIHSFTSDGTFNSGDLTEFEALFVGGGGAGAGSTASAVGTGGGGAGEYYADTSLSLLKNTDFAVSLGAAGLGASGASGGDGGDTTFIGTGTSITARGGGGGGRGGNGKDGGSGGGQPGVAATNPGASTAVFPGLGNSGGTSAAGRGGGGGGGAAAAGTGATNSSGASGGAGISNSISGSAVTYCKGGNGSNTSGSANGTAGTNPGDGGNAASGGATRTGGNGVIGRVIIRYLTPLNATWTIAGVATPSIKGSADIRATTSISGQGAVNFIYAPAGSVYTIAGQAAVSGAGALTRSAAFSGAGIGTGAFAGASEKAAAFSAAGQATIFAFMRVTFEIAGEAALVFEGVALSGSNISSNGTCTVSFEGSSYTNGNIEEATGEAVVEFVGSFNDWVPEDPAGGDWT